MGSIGTFRPRGLTDKEFFEGEYPSLEMLDTSRKGGVIYAAARRRDGSGVEYDGQVFALVMPFSNGGGEFVYKEQDETMGPCDAEVPRPDPGSADADRRRLRERVAREVPRERGAARGGEGAREARGAGDDDPDSRAAVLR